MLKNYHKQIQQVSENLKVQIQGIFILKTAPKKVLTASI